MAFVFDLELIRSLPQLCLVGYRQLDSGSTYASFIKEVYEDCCFSPPHSTNLSLRGEYHFACAEGCYLKLDGLTVPTDYNGCSGFIEWLFLESHARPRDIPNSLLPFEGLALIVFLTEWCIADISTPDEHFRQAFYQGKAVTHCERRFVGNLPQNGPLIQLQFVLSPPKFSSRIVSLEQIKQTLIYLRSYRLIPKGLRLINTRSTNYGFEAKIKTLPYHKVE